MTTAPGLGSSLKDRLEFIGLDNEARGRLKNLKPIVEKAIGPALAVFYERVRATPEARRFFRDDSHMSGAKGRQEQHWGVIVDAEYGETYEKGVRAIGLAHARLGLEPRLYIGGYALVTEQLVKSVIAERPTSLFSRGNGPQLADELSALVKAVLLDMDLAISIYLEELESKRAEAEAQKAVAERNQKIALDALTEALRRLSEGDLTTRLTAEVAAEFESLKSDFNNATAELERAMGHVTQTSNAIGESAGEIGHAADDMSRRTEQQAASLEQSAAALNQLTSSVRQATESARETASKVMATRGEAENSGKIVQNAVTAMSEIEKSSSEIAQIIGVIDEIAFQTNLLALNAGVEAARAGEAGRGFAVVASEVRSLAQRSAEAAKEIKALISTSSGQVQCGVKLISETGAVSGNMISRFAEIDHAVTGLAASSREQATGLSEVNVAITQMDQATQQNAAMVEQTTAAVHSLRTQAEELIRTVARFKVGAIGAAQPRAEAPRRGSAPARRAGFATQGNAALAAPASDDWQEF